MTLFLLQPSVQLALLSDSTTLYENANSSIWTNLDASNRQPSTPCAFERAGDVGLSKESGAARHFTALQS
jgi:hypothetical protein